MGRWADRFLKSVGNFNMTMRPIFTNQDGQRIVRAQPFPPEQLVGNFLNFARARMQHVLLEAVRSIRNDDRRFTGLDANLEFEEGGPTPSDIAADEESRAIAITSVTQALRVTPEPHRTVVQMIYFEGKSLKEVADRLDRTIDSVKHLHATAKKLVKQLITTQD
jgi:RNA polymerase sigma factor (sigma-70 family)